MQGLPKPKKTFNLVLESRRSYSEAATVASPVQQRNLNHRVRGTSLFSDRYTGVMFRIASKSSWKHLQRISTLTETGGKYARSVGNVHNYSSLPPVEQSLAGQVAIITGGASGIGARTARVFTQHGARVVIADVQADLGMNLAKELGSKSQFVYCDVRKEDDIIKAWETAYALENKLDIVFNNAGILGALCPLYELPIAEFDATMAINVRAMVLGIKHAARLMIPAGKGSIVCTSSVAGGAGGLFAFSYSLSKASIVSMVKCAAAELRRFGIRVNSIAPDLIPTPMGVDLVRAMTEVGPGKFGIEKFSVDSTAAPKEETAPSLNVEMLDEMIKQSSLIEGRHITEHDISDAVLYLASDAGGYITGHNLPIDGGRVSLKLVDPETQSWATTSQPMVNIAGQRGLILGDAGR